ncbi:hypothetical protein BS47DRAFT_1392256 [Hydnum rufescens UP504]|uniref:Uncharacterized protein n=1 Tax=Hydnum rufescens UP504 TaxID=1448309 RepID=A0A9P6AZ36_9AGAM|nr:hypothetical protein BS47DRAFT_1392256 [Hydnum rufescens UP504]
MDKNPRASVLHQLDTLILSNGRSTFASTRSPSSISDVCSPTAAAIMVPTTELSVAQKSLASRARTSASFGKKKTVGPSSHRDLSNSNTEELYWICLFIPAARLVISEWCTSTGIAKTVTVTPKIRVFREGSETQHRRHMPLRPLPKHLVVVEAGYRGLELQDHPELEYIRSEPPSPSEVRAAKNDNPHLDSMAQTLDVPLSLPLRVCLSRPQIVVVYCIPRIYISNFQHPQFRKH